MPQNGTIPQDWDPDDPDLREEPDAPQGTEALSDKEFDDLVKALRDQWL